MKIIVLISTVTAVVWIETNCVGRILTRLYKSTLQGLERHVWNVYVSILRPRLEDSYEVDVQSVKTHYIERFSQVWDGLNDIWKLKQMSYKIPYSV